MTEIELTISQQYVSANVDLDRITEEVVQEIDWDDAVRTNVDLDDMVHEAINDHVGDIVSEWCYDNLDDKARDAVADVADDVIRDVLEDQGVTQKDNEYDAALASLAVRVDQLERHNVVLRDDVNELDRVVGALVQCVKNLGVDINIALRDIGF